MRSSFSNLLDELYLPTDLKQLSKHELHVLAKEIRSRLLSIADICGGHLASNLGVVELTLVLHTLLDSPNDKIIWDTSHQAYVHKILTGRLKQMHTIRKYGGLSGFCKITESVHDIFGAGHASTALSSALGIAKARDFKHESYLVAAVVGDAALSGGMAFEAINNIQLLNKDSNFMFVLNDNDMAISPSVGMMSSYLSKLRSKSDSSIFNSSLDLFFSKFPYLGGPLKDYFEKYFLELPSIIPFSKSELFFEDFGFHYLGPIDGHDISALMAAFTYAKSYKGSVILHILTKKGKGLLEAEKNPEKYHGVKAKLWQENGSFQPLLMKKKPTYSEIFGQAVMDICSKRDDVIVVTPAMEGGSGLSHFRKNYPNRFFDVGIAEEHAVTFCAGLAKGGLRPILAIYSTFLQRGYDQLIHDICLQNIPVVFCLDRAGLVGEDGSTHHGVFDYNYMLPIPNLTILAPKDGHELKKMLNWSLNQNNPISIRYPKGEVPSYSHSYSRSFDGSAEILFKSELFDLRGYDLLLIGVGSMVWPAYEVAKEFASEQLTVAVINLRSIKPLDTQMLTSYLEGARSVFVLEEGMAIGGVYSYILKVCQSSIKALNSWRQIALDDVFIEHGSISELKQESRLSVSHISNFIRKRIYHCDSKICFS